MAERLTVERRTRECRLALLYAVAMTKFSLDDPIFGIVNRAIIRCMSLTALERIKKNAWEYFPCMKTADRRARTEEMALDG